MYGGIFLQNINEPCKSTSHDYGLSGLQVLLHIRRFLWFVAKDHKIETVSENCIFDVIINPCHKFNGKLLDIYKSMIIHIQQEKMSEIAEIKMNISKVEIEFKVYYVFS